MYINLKFWNDYIVNQVKLLYNKTCEILRYELN